MADSIDKNMIDKDEYPQTAEIESLRNANQQQTVMQSRY